MDYPYGAQYKTVVSKSFVLLETEYSLACAELSGNFLSLTFR